MTLGKRIKFVRLAAKISQLELEKRTGIKREYLSKLENSRLKNPTINTLKKIAAGLRIDFLALLTDNPKILTILGENQ